MKKRILVVSHNSVERTLIYNLLNRFNYEIISDTNGEECLMKARSERPNLIILDVFIFKKNGFIVCRMLKSIPSLAQIPVILLTNATKKDDEFWGADMYISKPLDYSKLIKAVFHYLSKHLLLRYEREERRQQRQKDREQLFFLHHGFFV